MGPFLRLMDLYYRLQQCGSVRPDDRVDVWLEDGRVEAGVVDGGPQGFVAGLPVGWDGQQRLEND